MEGRNKRTKKKLKSWTKSINIISFPIFQSIDFTCFCSFIAATEARVKYFTYVGNIASHLTEVISLQSSYFCFNFTAMERFNWFLLPSVQFFFFVIVAIFSICMHGSINFPVFLYIVTPPHQYYFSLLTKRWNTMKGREDNCSLSNILIRHHLKKLKK